MFSLLCLSLYLLCTTDLDLQGDLLCRMDPSEMTEVLNVLSYPLWDPVELYVSFCIL